MASIKQQPRDITDFINDSINRVKDTIELLEYINTKQKALSKSGVFIASIVDLYSRDSINVLSNILDEDRQASSLFALCELVKTEKDRRIYRTQIMKIKDEARDLLIARYNKVGHFNTKNNSMEQDGFPVNVPIVIDPAYLRNRIEKIELMFWELKSKLGIDGIFIVHKGSILNDFKQLIKG